MKNEEFAAIRKLWLMSQGDYFCISTKSPTGKWKDNFFSRREISKAKKLIEQRDKFDIYFSPQGFSKPSRDKNFALPPNLFFADLDEANPFDIDIKPTVCFQSSPGRYVGFWFSDKPVSEELNRRMTYHTGADQSGWDFSQVLRVPGTKNHKYADKPKVKILWQDGPKQQLDRVVKVLPEVEDDKGRVTDEDTTELYKSYEKSMSRELRKELTNPRVQVGKRSEVLWKMVCELIEIGMTGDEVFDILIDNAWNKHADRRDGGEKQLRREIDKATSLHIGGTAGKKVKKKKPLSIKPRKKLNVETETDSEKRFSLITMDKVEEEEVDWIIEKVFAKGQTSIVEGDPGVGKSYFLMWVAKFLCDGEPLPWEDPKKHRRRPMKVLYADMENSRGAVTKHRLQDNGLKNGHNYLQVTEHFSIDDEESIDAFVDEVIKVFKPDIVIIDPINLYIGGTDTYRASETQQALQVFKQLSEDFDFSLVIVRHLNKGASGKALYAGNGSIAFAGVARIIMTVGWHPEEPDVRVVACTKNNLSQFFGSFGYTIQGLPDTIKRKNRSVLSYVGTVEYTSDDILGTVNTKDDSTKEVAVALIKEMMGDEKEVGYHAVLKQGDTRSISETSIKKAAAEMGLERVTKGRGKTRKTLLRYAAKD